MPGMIQFQPRMVKPLLLMFWLGVSFKNLVLVEQLVQFANKIPNHCYAD